MASDEPSSGVESRLLRDSSTGGRGFLRTPAPQSASCFPALGLQVACGLGPRLPARLPRERLRRGFLPLSRSAVRGLAAQRGGGALWPRLIRPRSRRTPAAPGAAVPPLRLAALGHRASADRCRTRPLVQPMEVCCVCELPVAAGTNCHRTGGFKQHTRLSSHGSAGRKCKQGSWG